MKQRYDPSRVPRIDGARVTVLQSGWYAEHTDEMVRKCRAVLREAGCAAVDVERVPGALELPFAAQTLAASAARRPDAIVCIGAIVKGETLHFETVAEECIRGLGEVMRRHDIPIIIEVLPVLSIDQLVARSGDDDRNKGIEAAVAAAEVVAWRRKLEGDPST